MTNGYRQTPASAFATLARERAQPQPIVIETLCPACSRLTRMEYYKTIGNREVYNCTNPGCHGTKEFTVR